MRALPRAIVCLAMCGMGWGAAAAGGAQPIPDPFLDAHRVALALNRPRIDFQIRFKDARTNFTPREPIVLELVFELPPGCGLLGFMPEDPCRGWPLAQVVIDPPHGVSTPQTQLCRDLAERIPAGVLSGRPGGSLVGAGGAPLPKPPPVILTLTVNDWHRFDRPGAFRLYVRSRHTTGDGSDAPPQTSNVLAFTIGTRDAAYERERVAAATATLDAPAATPAARRAALRELGRLATEDAAPALVRFYPTSREEPREADLAIAGLLMVPDRAGAVAAMEAELQRERGLAPGFVRDLAALEVGRRGTPHPAAQAEYLALVAQYTGVRARALDAVPGRLEAAFRDDLRAGGALDGTFYRGVLGPVAIQYPRQVMAAFATLSSNAQRNLLTDSWRRFADPAFVPLVRRLALQSGSGDCALRDIAFRRWHELAPAEARRALRRERTRRRPRVSIETLALLDDVAAPSLQRAWAQWVVTADDEAVVTAAAERLERFGTRAGARDAATAWRSRGRTLNVDAAAAVLGYLIRVDPAVGLPALRDTLGGATLDSGGPAFLGNAGLLWHVGFREWTPALEAIVIASLQHPARRVRDDAALLLRDFGSPAAREPVEASLMAANGRLTAAATRRPWDPRAEVEDRDDTLGLLASALGEARHWTLTDVESGGWADRCATSVCRAAFEHVNPALDPSRTIRVSAPTPGAEGLPTFNVDDVELTGEQALLDKLAQYPRGSRFGWLQREWPFPQGERWPLEERQQLFDRVVRQAARASIEITMQRAAR